MTRPIPDLAVDFVSQWEGCELSAYRDVAGVWTVGFGHTGADVIPGLRITKAQAMALLKDDLRVAAARLEARVGKEVLAALSEEQFTALLSFAFNLGANPSWTIWKVLKARKFDQVPPQLMRFVNAGGKVVSGLVNRRAAEWNFTLPASNASGSKSPPSQSSSSSASSSASAGLARTEQICW